MPSTKQEAQRRARANEAAAAKQKQLEAFTEAPNGTLTTSQGVVVPDNHNSLKAGARGPLLAEDFILRDKLAHFEHERIPERVLFARGAGAHGYFELTRSMAEYSSAAVFQDLGARTPVFVRFSNMTGSLGSADTVRDMRGFAVKFYTREGNWDLVGASLPVFFVQDAMKLPDLAHAIKPQPHHGMPQASSAHDGFWDFVSLMPECTHALMWLMSDRALPRSWRMMDGFGVHTFRLVNAQGVGHYAKFHWKPKLGRHALLDDEARRIAGEDPDFLRRDLWEAIDGECFPEWELSLQLIPDSAADSLGFDILDATKLVPEELAAAVVVGRLVLNRNCENFFAESEQVAFHPGHVVPGIDFTADPLLQGRLASYTGSQISRLGGPNHGELPINRAVCPVHSFRRDGAHRTAIAQGAVAYEPNTLATGAEFRVDGGQQGFQSHAQTAGASKSRARNPAFDDHFSQASLFWNSQPPVEREHIVAAFQRELWKVGSASIRERVVDNLAHVDARLARRVADGLGIAAVDARAAAGRAGYRDSRGKSAIQQAASLGVQATKPSIATRRVAVLVAPGVEVAALRVIQQALQEAKANCRVLAERIGAIATASGQQLVVEHTFCSLPSVLFDAVIVPGGVDSVESLARNAHAMGFLREAFRHGKTVCLVGEASRLLERLSIDSPEAASGVPGLVLGRNDPPARAQLAQDFIAALERHRHWERTQFQGAAA
jgi:catalase